MPTPHPRSPLTGVPVLLLALACTSVQAQSSPAFGPLGATPAAAVTAAAPDPMPLDDYLGLLRQIAPAAEQGARIYLSALAQRCGYQPGTAWLRRAFTEGSGDPALLGLVRAQQQRDTQARQQWLQVLRCPSGAQK